MHLSDPALDQFADAIAYRNTRSQFESHLVRGEFYGLSDLSGEHSDFRKILVKKDFVLAILEDIRERGRLEELAHYLNEHGALPDKALATFFPESDNSATAPPRPNPRKPAQAPGQDPRFRLPRPDWRLLATIAGVLVAIFVCLYGNNLCQQAIRPEWTSPIVSRFCPVPPTPTAGPPVTFPPSTPTPLACAAPGEDWDCDCISSNFWTSFTSPGPQKVPSQCLALGEWGLGATDGRLLITAEGPPVSPTSPVSIRRGIFTNLGTEARITLSLRIDDLYTPRSDDVANITVGVIRTDPPTPTSGVFLIYQIESPISPIQMKKRERGSEADYLDYAYTLGEDHEIAIVLTSVDVSVFVDGDQLLAPMTRPHEPALWIGYLLPRGGSIRASVTNLIVETP